MEDQVAAILRTCHQLDVPVVARGAGTSLSGGALPNAAGIVLSLAKFRKIVAIDVAAHQGGEQIALSASAQGWVFVSGLCSYGISYVLTYVAEETIASGLVAIAFTLMVFFTPNSTSFSLVS